MIKRPLLSALTVAAAALLLALITFFLLNTARPYLPLIIAAGTFGAYAAARVLLRKTAGKRPAQKMCAAAAAFALGLMPSAAVLCILLFS